VEGTLSPDNHLVVREQFSKRQGGGAHGGIKLNSRREDRTKAEEGVGSGRREKGFHGEGEP